jgi:UDP-3-O-[3-hydroxymyristoyl] glucosamine N-acyltransferase
VFAESESGVTAILKVSGSDTRPVSPPRIHETADVTLSASIGDGTLIWHQVQIREGAQIGENCIIGKGAYIDAGVKIGSNCKIQNYALVYSGATLGDGVFIGPAAILTNDRYPRAINPDGELKRALDWDHGKIYIDDGVSIGAGAVLVTDIHIGRFATIGAGAVVTHNVPPHALMIGSPAYQCGWVCRCGRPMTVDVACPNCGDTIEGVRA